MKVLKAAVFVVLAISVFTAVEAQAEDIRGNWKVVASGHESSWIIGVEGNRIFGASKWSCCPGFRVDRISGKISGNQVTITRHHFGQGGPSGTQVYRGTVSDGKLTGSWSGIGGSGPFTAVISK